MGRSANKPFTRREEERHDRNVYVGRSTIKGAGRGLFARRRLRKGSVVGVMRGDLVRRDGPHVLWLYDEEQNGEMIGMNVVGPMRFINDDAHPNVELVDATEAYCVQVRALRTIDEGEEILWDYGGDLEASAR